MSEAHAPHWQADPLLQRGPARVPSFVRMPWDGQAALAFGPWRLHDKADPTGPQTEPVKNFSSAPAPVDAADTSSATVPPDAAADHALQAPPISGGDDSASMPDGGEAGAAPSGTPGPVTVAMGAASEQELQVARQQGYVLGIKDGLSKALHDLEAERQKEREAIRSLMIELRALEQNPQRFFEPLRRLALHLAEQLVRGELSASAGAIDRLVKSCLDDLGSHDKAVVVTLNPDDLQRLQALQIEAQGDMRLEPDPTLLPGSVRVRAHDAEIQDFIDRRLEALARRLLSDPEAWLQKSTLLHPQAIEPMPEDTPKRSWFSRQADVQDTPSKPVAQAHDSATTEPSSGEAASQNEGVQAETLRSGDDQGANESASSTSAVATDGLTAAPVDHLAAKPDTTPSSGTAAPQGSPPAADLEHDA